MSRAHYQTLFAYSGDNSRRLLDQAELLDSGELHANPGDGHSSVFDLFFHILATSRRWRIALETGQQPPSLDDEGFDTLPVLAAALADEAESWQALIAGLRDDEIAAAVSLKTWRGDTVMLERWRIFQHLVLHSMQHHSEIAHLLTLKGHSPGDLDFIFYRGA